MKEANSSKWMYMHGTADISLKWNDIRNADIILNLAYMRSWVEGLELREQLK